MIDANTKVKLPLLPFKDAERAELFNKRLATLHSEWALTHASLQLKAEQLKASSAELELTEKERTPEEDLNALDAYKAVQRYILTAQENQDSLMVKTREITDQIRDFLRPHLKGSPLETHIDKVNDRQVQICLLAMLHGTAGFKSNEEIEEESKKNSPV